MHGGIIMAAKSEVSVKWTGEKQFLGTDSTKHSVVLSAQDAENGMGVKPGLSWRVPSGFITAAGTAADRKQS